MLLALLLPCARGFGAGFAVGAHGAVVVTGMVWGSAAVPDPSLESEASFKGKELRHRPTAAAFSSIRRGNEAIYGHLQSDV